MDQVLSTIKKSATVEIYTYTPLADPRRYVRLLKTEPSKSDETVICSLLTFELSRAPRYYAISYTWGEAVNAGYIWIYERLFAVRRNCFVALCQVRHSDHSSYYWTDAVCINQGDVVEKSAQVQIMNEIYIRARRVEVSLGNHADSSELLFEKLRSVPFSQRDIDFYTWLERLWAQDQACLAELCRAYVALGQRRYWSRVWIVQELTLPVNIMIYYGFTNCGGEGSPFLPITFIGSNVGGEVSDPRIPQRMISESLSAGCQSMRSHMLTSSCMQGSHDRKRALAVSGQHSSTWI